MIDLHSIANVCNMKARQKQDLPFDAAVMEAIEEEMGERTDAEKAEVFDRVMLKYEDGSMATATNVEDGAENSVAGLENSDFPLVNEFGQAILPQSNRATGRDRVVATDNEPDENECPDGARRLAMAGKNANRGGGNTGGTAVAEAPAGEAGPVVTDDTPETGAPTTGEVAERVEGEAAAAGETVAPRQRREKTAEEMRAERDALEAEKRRLDLRIAVADHPELAEVFSAYEHAERRVKAASNPKRRDDTRAKEKAARELEANKATWEKTLAFYKKQIPIYEAKLRGEVVDANTGGSLESFTKQRDEARVAFVEAAKVAKVDVEALLG